MSTLVNICGTAYSGSTMLDLMLGNAPDAFSCGEVYAWFRPWSTHHFKIDCPCGENPCPYWEKVKNIPEDVFHKQVFEMLNVNFVIDSSKDISWVVDNNKWAIANQIKVVNILLWKNPVDLAYSYWKRGKGLKHWRSRFVNYYSYIFKIELPFVSVNYNELVQNPRSKLNEICKIVGMEYFSGKENFWEKQHHHLFGSASVRKQAENRASIIRSSKDFPVEFLNQIEQLSERVRKDVKVQNIIEILRKHDVSNEHIIGYNIKNVLPRRTYSIWYYLHRLKRKYRMRFPQVYTRVNS